MTSIIDSTRKNHALEHATMRVLAEHYKGVRMMGHSNLCGFVLVADLPTEIVTEAVLEAKRRLENGEPTWRCIQLRHQSGCFEPGWQRRLQPARLLGSKGKTPWHYLIASILRCRLFCWRNLSVRNCRKPSPRSVHAGYGCADGDQPKDNQWLHPLYPYRIGLGMA